MAKKSSSIQDQLSGIDSSTFPQQEKIVEQSGEANISIESSASDMKLNVTPTINDKVFNSRVEQAMSFASTIVKNASKSIEFSPQIRSSGPMVSSTGHSVINDMAGVSIDKFKSELETSLNNSLRKSGSPRIAGLAQANAAKREYLTMDVENTFSNPKKQELLSASYKLSGGQTQTLIHANYEELVKRDIEHFKSIGDIKNQHLMENVRSALKTGATSGLPNFKVVEPKDMRKELVDVINNNPQATMQGVRFNTDAQKLAQFIGNRSEDNKAATVALIGKKGTPPRVRNIEDDFRRHFELPSEYTSGQSVSHMAAMYGTLPRSKGAVGAHSSAWDVEQSEMIAAINDSLTEHEDILGLQNNLTTKEKSSGVKFDTKPTTLVKAIQERTSKPESKTDYMSRILATRALNTIEGIQSGKVDFKSVDNAVSAAHTMINDVRGASYGSLKDLSSPTSTIVSSGLTEEQKRTIAEQDYGTQFIGKKGMVDEIKSILEAQNTGRQPIILSGETDSETGSNLENLSHRYALQATHNLREVAYKNHGIIKPEHVQEELIKLNKALNTDFGPNIRVEGSDESHAFNSLFDTQLSGHRADANKFLGNITPENKGKGKKIAYADGNANAAELYESIKKSIRPAMQTSDIYLASIGMDKKYNPIRTPVSIDTHGTGESYLSDAVLSTPLTIREAVAKRQNQGDRAIGLKAVTSEIYKSITSSIEPTTNDLRTNQVEVDRSNPEAVTSKIKRMLAEKSFSSNLPPHLTENRNDSIAAIKEMESYSNMDAGTKFERSKLVEDLISKEHYTPVLPTAEFQGEGSKYEHSGIVGGITAHPDFLAHRPEKTANGFQRRYLLADMKMPVVPVEPGATIESMLHTSGQGEWVSQILGYAQSLPEEIRKHLDIGVIAGKKDGPARLIKAPVDSILKTDIAKQLLAVLNNSKPSQEHELYSLPKNLPTPGETNQKNFSAEELNAIAYQKSKGKDKGEGYIENILKLGRKLASGGNTSDTSILSMYKTPKNDNGTGASALKSAVVGLNANYNVPNGAFGTLPIPENEFHEKTLSALSMVAGAKNQKKVPEALLDAITGGTLKSVDVFKKHFEGINQSIEMEITAGDAKIEAKLSNLKAYRFNLGSGATAMFRGAYVAPELHGHRAKEEDLHTLSGGYQTTPEPNGPGAQSYEEAQLRANTEKAYLSQYNRSLLQKQMLVHGGEAKMSIVSPSPDTSYIQSFLVPGNKSQSKDDTYEKQLNLINQKIAHAKNELDAITGSKSSFDILKTINDKQVKQDSLAGADNVVLASKQLSLVNNTTGIEQGAHAFSYAQTYGTLQKLNLNEQQLTNMGLTHPSKLVIPDENKFLQGFQGAETTHETLTNRANLVSARTGLTSDEYESVSKRRDRALLNRQLDEHIADYADSINDTHGVAKDRRSRAAKTKVEAEALDSFLDKHGVSSHSEIDSRGILTPESLLQKSEGSRKDLIAKHVNNVLLEQTDADQHTLTPSHISKINESMSFLHSMGVNPSEYGIDLSSTMHFAETSGSKGSDKLNKLSENNGSTYIEHEKIQQAKVNYVKQLQEEYNKLNRTEIDSPFKTLAIAIETDQAKLKLLIEAAKTLSEGSEKHAANSAEQVATKTRLNTNLNLITGIEEPAILEEGMSSRALDHYRNTKEDRKKKALDDSGQLASALTEGDYSPKLLEDIHKQRKVNELLGVEHKGINDEAVAPAYEQWSNNPTRQRTALENIELSGSANKFVASAQVVERYNTDSAKFGSSDVNVFDIVHQKEQAALKVINEFKSALIETGETKLSNLDGQFLNLVKDIQLAIDNLKGMESTKIKTPEIQTNIENQRAHIENLISQADTSRNNITRPKLDKNAWGVMKEQAQNSAAIEDYDILRQSMAASAKVEALGPKASYSDFKKAHSLAGIVEQRGLATDEAKRDNEGLKSQKDITELAKNSGKNFFEGIQHVNFAEQLVDLANWQVQWAGATAITQGFTTALFGGYGAAKVFEAEMRDIQLVSQASGTQIEDLKDRVVDLGQNFKVPVKELSEGLILLGQTGFKAAESIQMIKPISQLAVATGATHKQATDITTTVMMAYDQPSANTADITNAMAAMSTTSKLEIGSLGTTFNYIAATAAAAGLSIEETATAMGLMSNAGIRASTIGMSLRSILGALLAPTDRFSAELGRVGLSVDELSPRSSSLGAILEKLHSHGFNVESAFEGMNKREAGGMTALLNQSGKWNEYKDRVTGTNRAETMAVGQMDTYDAQMKRLENNAQLAGIKTFEGSMGPLKIGAKALSSGFEKVAGIADSSFGKAATEIVTTTLAIGSVATLGTTLYNVLRTISPAVKSGLSKSFGGTGRVAPDESKSKIYQGVESMIGMGINRYALAGTAVMAGAYYSANTLLDGDSILGIDTNKSWNPLNRKTAALQKATAGFDFMENQKQVLEEAAKEQYKLTGKPNQTDTSEHSAYVKSLVTSGLFIGYNSKGEMVDANALKRNRSAQPVGVYGGLDRSKVDLEVMSRTFGRMQEEYSTPKLINQMMDTGSATYTDNKKLYGEEGRSFTQATADRIISSMKQRGTFYDNTVVQNEVAGLGNTNFAEEVRSEVLKKHNTAMTTDDMPEARRAASKTAFIRASKSVEDIRSVLTDPTSARASSTQKTLLLHTIDDAQHDEKTRKFLLSNAGIDKDLQTSKAKIASTDVGTPEYNTALEDYFKKAVNYSRNFSELRPLGDIQKTYNTRYAQQFSEGNLFDQTALETEAIAKYHAYNPEKIRGRFSFSNAKGVFGKEVNPDLEKFRELTKQYNAAVGIGDMPTAEAISIEREDLGGTLKAKYKESLTFAIPGLDPGLNKTAKDLRYASRFAGEDMAEGRGTIMPFLPTIAMGEFRTQADALTESYGKMRQQAINMIKTKSGDSQIDSKILARIDLAAKIDMHDLEEGIVEKFTAKIKVVNEKLNEIANRSLKLNTIGIGLNLDVSNIKIDRELSDKKTSEMLKGFESTRYASGYSNTGTSSYGGPTRTSHIGNLIDISAYSPDVELVRTVAADRSKLDLSNKSEDVRYKATLETINETERNTISVLPVARYSPNNAGVGPSNELKTDVLMAMQKAEESRIEASNASFNTVRKNLEEELKLREKVAEKILAIKDAEASTQEHFENSRKEFQKASGIDVTEKPTAVLTNMHSLERSYAEAMDKGDLTGGNKILAKADEQKKELLTGGRANPKQLKEAEEIFTRMAVKNVEGSEIQTSKLKREGIRPLNEDIEKTTATMMLRVDDIKTGIANSTKLSSEEKQYRTKDLDERVRAAEGSPEKLLNIITETNKSPGASHELTIDETYEALSRVMASSGEAFGTLNAATMGAVTAMNKFATAGGVTPTKEALTQIQIPTSTQNINKTIDIHKTVTGEHKSETTPVYSYNPANGIIPVVTGTPEINTIRQDIPTGPFDKFKGSDGTVRNIKTTDIQTGVFDNFRGIDGKVKNVKATDLMKEEIEQTKDRPLHRGDAVVEPIFKTDMPGHRTNETSVFGKDKYGPVFPKGDMTKEQFVTGMTAGTVVTAALATGAGLGLIGGGSQVASYEAGMFAQTQAAKIVARHVARHAGKTALQFETEQAGLSSSTGIFGEQILTNTTAEAVSTEAVPSFASKALKFIAGPPRFIANTAADAWNASSINKLLMLVTGGIAVSKTVDFGREHLANIDAKKIAEKDFSQYLVKEQPKTEKQRELLPANIAVRTIEQQDIDNTQEAFAASRKHPNFKPLVEPKLIDRTHQKLDDKGIWHTRIPVPVPDSMIPNYAQILKARLEPESETPVNETRENTGTSKPPISGIMQNKVEPGSLRLGLPERKNDAFNEARGSIHQFLNHKFGELSKEEWDAKAPIVPEEKKPLVVANKATVDKTIAASKDTYTNESLAGMAGIPMIGTVETPKVKPIKVNEYGIAEGKLSEISKSEFKGGSPSIAMSAANLNEAIKSNNYLNSIDTNISKLVGGSPSGKPGDNQPVSGNPSNASVTVPVTITIGNNGKSSLDYAEMAKAPELKQAIINVCNDFFHIGTGMAGSA